MTARGWYALTPLAAIAPGTEHRFRLDGRRYRLQRHRSGRLQVRERVMPLRCHSGMVFCWPTARAPDFELPDLDLAGWPPMSFEYRDVRTRPEQIQRDLVDLGHFETVHRYANVSYAERPKFQDSQLRVAVDFDWDTGLAGRGVRAHFTSEAHGLGYQLTEVRSLRDRYHTRHLVMPTPLDALTTRVHLGVSARVHGRLGRGLLGHLMAPLASALIAVAQRRDIARDAHFWAGQSAQESTAGRYEQRYRDWARHFSETP